METVNFVISIMPRLMGGLQVAMRITAVSLMLGLVLGLILAFLRIYTKGLPQLLAKGYIELMRGTPLLVQLMIIYYGLPDVGISFNRMTAVYVALGLNSAAYQAEYFRGAVQAIDVGQMMAARTLGMTRWQSVLYVILPQALRLVIPSWTNELIYMVKYASVAFVVAVPELLATGKIIASSNFRYTEIYLTIAVIYIVVLSCLGWIAEWIEKRYSIPGLATDKIR